MKKETEIMSFDYSKWYSDYRTGIQESFELGTPLSDQVQECTDPTGKYKIVMTPYRISSGQKIFTEIVVHKVVERIKPTKKPREFIIATLQANYNDPIPHFWCVPHPESPDQNILVICEDRFSATLLNLNTGKKTVLFFSDLDLIKQGLGFCADSIHVSEDFRWISFVGSVFMEQNSIRTYAFGSPSLLKDLSIWNPVSVHDKFWFDNVCAFDKASGYTKILVSRNQDLSSTERPLSSMSPDERKSYLTQVQMGRERIIVGKNFYLLSILDSEAPATWTYSWVDRLAD